MNWLTSKKFAGLFDEMGLGKSRQAIMAANELQLTDILVICPAVARINWRREFEKFWNESTIPLSGIKLEIVSYEEATRHQGRITRRRQLIIVDEAHYVKSITAKRTIAILGKEGLVRFTDRCWLLTGTPTPNNASELWSILFTFGFTKLKFTSFVERYCNYYDAPHGRQITGNKKEHLQELKDAIDRFALRRKKEDVMKELPPISFSQIIVPSTPVDIEIESSFIQYAIGKKGREILEEKLAREKALVEGVVRSNGGYTMETMRTLETLSGSIATLRRYMGLEKAPALVDMVAQELESNAYQKIVIFCIHRDVIVKFRDGLKQFGPVTLYGGTEPEKRQHNIDRFQMNPKIRVFVANIQAAGTAITLTAANQILFAEQDWVPGNNSQAAMRCHRIGQSKPVFVRVASLANSFDERVGEVLRRKTREISELLDRDVLQTKESTVNPNENTFGFSTAKLLEGIDK